MRVHRQPEIIVNLKTTIPVILVRLLKVMFAGQDDIAVASTRYLWASDQDLLGGGQERHVLVSTPREGRRKGMALRLCPKEYSASRHSVVREVRTAKVVRAAQSDHMVCVVAVGWRPVCWCRFPLAAYEPHTILVRLGLLVDIIHQVAGGGKWYLGIERTHDALVFPIHMVKYHVALVALLQRKKLSAGLLKGGEVGGVERDTTLKTKQLGQVLGRRTRGWVAIPAVCRS